MNIYSIQLENYRCFLDRIINFSPIFNVLVGVNGSGKSSVLKGICESLTGGLIKFIPTTLGPEPLHDADDVRLEIVERKKRLRFERRFPVTIRTTGEFLGQSVDWTLSKKTSLAQANIEGTMPGGVLAPSLQTGLDPDITMPVIAFYRASRDWKRPQPNEVAAASARDSRADAYNHWRDASADADGLQTWVISKSLERAQEAAESGRPFDAVNDDELAHTNAALFAAFDEAKNLYYDVRQKTIVIEWTSSADGAPHITPFENLSDGQRVAVCLITDIARRMCLLNPHLGNEVRNTPGIVLIDELDIHLHPEWQRLITRGPLTLTKTDPGFAQKTDPPFSASVLR